MEQLDSVHSKYARDIFNHVYRFMSSVNHLRESSISVALSGGVDSVVLLYTLKWLEVNFDGPKVSAHHINHGTREGCEIDEKFCVDLCKSLSVELKVSKLNLSISTSNFENEARIRRYTEFKKYLKPQSLMALGQHIDDSFEWSMMQGLRSSNLKATLGVPVNNGVFIRPFMCLTKSQIRALAKELNLSWNEDKSNSDLRFDRNFIRNIAEVKLSKRYPQMLKHYVNKSNELARLLNLSSIKMEESSDKVMRKSWKGLGTCFINTDYKSKFAPCFNQLHEAICTLSTSNRGVLHKQIDKFIKMGERGSTGPLEFSGGVFGFHSKGCLFLVNKDGLKEFEHLDEQILSSLQSGKVASQIPVGELKNRLFYETNTFWPFLMFGPSKNENFIKSLRSINPLMPKTTKYCLDNGIWFQNLSKILDISHKKIKFYL